MFGMVIKGFNHGFHVIIDVFVEGDGNLGNDNHNITSFSPHNKPAFFFFFRFQNVVMSHFYCLLGMNRSSSEVKLQPVRMENFTVSLSVSI